MARSGGQGEPFNQFRNHVCGSISLEVMHGRINISSINKNNPLTNACNIQMESCSHCALCTYGLIGDNYAREAATLYKGI